MEQFYTIKQVAEKLAVSEMTIYRKISNGLLKSTKVGNRYRISESDFNNFINATRS